MPTAPPRANVAAPPSLPLPLRFETSHVGFDAIARGRDYMLTLHDASATLTLPSPDGRHPAIRMSLAGGNPDAVAAPLERQTGVTNYLLGKDLSKWRLGVRGYHKVKYWRSIRTSI